jgi:hypothetical protein
VDEGVHIPELQLDGGADVVEAHDLGKLRYDAKSAVEFAKMIVG